MLGQKSNNPNAAIYADLGSGTSYGGATLPTYTTNRGQTVPLNSVGRNALLAAQRNDRQS